MALIIVSFLCVILGMPRILQLEGINSSSSIAFSTAGLTRLTIGEDGTVAFSNSAKFEFLYVSNSIVNNDYPNTKISFTVADAIVFQTSALERIRITSLGGISFGATGTNFGASNQLLISAGNLPPSWGLVANVNVSASAAIAYTKLALGTSIVNSDISATAEIAYTKLNLDLSVVNADISATAGIVDTKLATISTAGKVSNSATTATNANTASAIVARDASGNFSAGTITAAFSGNVTGNAGTVTDGVYLSTTQTVSGRKTFTSSMAGGSLLVATGSLGPIELQTSGANASLLTFHRAGSYASYFGLDTDNQFAVGGWSAGAALANMKVGSFGVGTAASGTAGEIRATNNITAYYSDERLKDFIGKISNALEKVNSLNGYYYKENSKAKEFGYNNDSVQVGVSAQEVEKILPEIVTLAPIDCATDSAGKTISKTGQNYKTVYYEKLIPLLIEAIKELSSEIEILKNK